MIARDKKLHLIGGAIVAAYLLLVMFSAQHLGFWWTLIWASLAAGAGIEAYQGFRNEGEPDPLDALASSAVGVLIGAFALLSAHL